MKSSIHRGFVALGLAMSLNAASAAVVTHQFSAVLNYFNGDLTTLDLSAPTNVLSGTFTYDTDLQKIGYNGVHTYQHVGSPAAFSAELFLNGAPLAHTGNQSTLVPCPTVCSERSVIRQTNEELSYGAQDDVSFRYSFSEAGNPLRLASVSISFGFKAPLESLPTAITADSLTYSYLSLSTLDGGITFGGGVTTPIQISPVPEPSNALLLLIGLGGLGWVAARSRKASRQTTGAYALK